MDGRILADDHAEAIARALTADGVDDADIIWTLYRARPGGGNWYVTGGKNLRRWRARWAGGA
jgi:hypothetical protein